MQTVIAIGSWFVLHWSEALGYLGASLTAVIGLCLLIPGEQPEKALQGVVNVLKKISLK